MIRCSFFDAPFSRQFFYVLASNVLLDLEVGRRALGFALVLYLTGHYPL